MPGDIVAEWGLKTVSVPVSLPGVHILGTNSMLYVGLTVNLTAFVQYFINKSKHGQNTLPRLGGKDPKRIFTVLNV